MLDMDLINEEQHPDTHCLLCGDRKTEEELESGHDFCWDCFMERND